MAEDAEIKKLRNKLTKIKMSAPRGKNDLKSNVELGRDLDLYVVSEVVGQGLPLLTPKGTAIKREIERFVVDEEIKRGYKHVSTPFMAKSDLFKISGHWQHYQDNMFTLNVGEEKFALRPMTCPFHFVLFKSKPRSYKELPLKYAEISTLFRNEKSGELRGLTRVRQMTLSDAHIICAPEQLEEEFTKVLDLIKFSMEKLGITGTYYRFSKKGDNKEKYVDNPKAWEKTQEMMKKILDKLELEYEEADDEAAFYGPKLDIQAKDVYGKEDTFFTVQIDFALPENFELDYKDKNGKDKRAMVIHRSSTGTTERVMAHLLELTQGNLKLWISPVQVKVLPMNKENLEYSKKLVEKLHSEGIRVEIDGREIPVSKKVRDAQLQKVNYMVTVGNKEQESNTLAIRSREGKVEYNIKPEDFIKKLNYEIQEKE